EGEEGRAEPAKERDLYGRDLVRASALAQLAVFRAHVEIVAEIAAHRDDCTRSRRCRMARTRGRRLSFRIGLRRKPAAPSSRLRASTSAPATPVMKTA